MDFPSGVLLLGDFLPSSEGSKPFPSCSSVTPMAAVGGRKERKREKGHSAVNKLSIAPVPWPLGGAATCQGLAVSVSCVLGQGN